MILTFISLYPSSTSARAVAKACIRSYSLLQSQALLPARYIRLLESGMSKEDAWKLLVVEILVNAGLIVPEHLNPSPASVRTESVQIPVFEAKLVKVTRIEPADDDRIRRLLGQARREAEVSKEDSPRESSIIRRALLIGLDALEREHAQK